jgi:hypothetical protein
MAMAQVRASVLGGLGLFATKPFAPGDVILEENPLITLAPLSADEEDKLVELLLVNKNKKNIPQQCSLWNSLKIPSTLPKQAHGQFRGMVQAGLCFDYTMQKVGGGESEEKLLKLYHPTSTQEVSTLEEGIIHVSNVALDYIKNHTKNPPSASDEVLRKVMLIWACNSFEGGRIYDTMSRVNHSCDPNAIIQVSTQQQQLVQPQQPLESAKYAAQRLVAAAPIAEGDEICISYLGLFLYAETSVRIDLLQQQKHFTCDCPRCTAGTEDKTARIPCPTRHPRQGASQILDEDVQYDDELEVLYVTWSTLPEATTSTKEMKRLQQVMSSVTQKVVSYLQDHHQKGLSKKPGQQRPKETEDDDDDDNESDEDEILEEHVSLASTVMGAQHWTTNLLLLLHLDRRLSQMSQHSLLTQQLPSMEDIAETIDSLERVLRFIQGVGLSVHHGHVLADVIIGVARCLVGLGDEKSQKYGCEWLDNLGDYVSLFETDGRKKVVDTLRGAWKKTKAEDKGKGPAKKKSKSS